MLRARVRAPRKRGTDQCDHNDEVRTSPEPEQRRDSRPLEEGDERDDPICAAALGVQLRPVATRVALLDLDPDLGAALAPDRFARARAELTAPIVRLPRGEWAGSAASQTDHQNVGLLVVDGVIAREVVLVDTVSTELLGAGDLIRPWGRVGEPQLLAHTIRWQVLAEARLAVLGRAFAVALARWPEVNAALLDRACARAQRLATTQAISHLNSVDRRLLALFWHFAERWGRITPAGIVVPLRLSHRLLAELVGARRPTVTAALAALARDGTLLRRDDASWLLTGEAPEAPVPTVRRVVSHRRRLLAADAQRTR
jgi:CRP/FNR family transcriptional regulator, cyclic AMP receptor protein